MNLRQLEAFRATYLTGSVSRAADVLHVSQPSVSRLVADLEASVGFKLFNRSARGLNPTAEGRRLFDAVERSFIGVGEIRVVANAIKNLNSGEVSLGVIPAFAYSAMPQAVASFHTRSSEIKLNVNIRTTQTIIEEIETGRLDVGLISPISDNPNIATYFRKSFAYVCILPASHPLANTTSPIDLMALGDDEFVTLDPLYLNFISTDRALLEFMNSRSRLSSHSAPIVAALAQATGSIAIVDPFTADFLALSSRIVCKPIHQEINYEVALVGRGDLSLPARFLAETLEKVIKDWSAPI